MFAGLTDHPEVWRNGLEDWNVERSEITLEWEARGEARGELNRMRADLLRVLQVRFGESLPEDVTKAIQAQANLTTLDAWFTCALTAGNLDELRPVLGLGAAQ